MPRRDKHRKLRGAAQPAEITESGVAGYTSSANVCLSDYADERATISRKQPRPLDSKLMAVCNAAGELRTSADGVLQKIIASHSRLFGDRRALAESLAHTMRGAAHQARWLSSPEYEQERGSRNRSRRLVRAELSLRKAHETWDRLCDIVPVRGWS